MGLVVGVWPDLGRLGDVSHAADLLRGEKNALLYRSRTEIYRQNIERFFWNMAKIKKAHCAFFVLYKILY